jgi:hypothetical protein
MLQRTCRRAKDGCSNSSRAQTYCSVRQVTYVTCDQGVSVRYFYAVTGVRYFRTITRGSARYFRTVTSVAHFRVMASEVAFGVDFLAISLETLRCAQQLTKLFMFLYQKGVRSQSFPTGRTRYSPCTGKSHHYTSRCHQPPRPLFQQCHHLPVRCFQSVTSGAPYVP